MENIKINDDITLNFNCKSPLGEPKCSLPLSSGENLNIIYCIESFKDVEDRYFLVSLDYDEIDLVENETELKKLVCRILDNLTKQGKRVIQSSEKRS